MAMAFSVCFSASSGYSISRFSAPAFLGATATKPSHFRSSLLPPLRCPLHRRCRYLLPPRSTSVDGRSDANPVEALTVPLSWMDPSNALQESEWLRVTLHKWLDEEYCPEPTNIEISKVVAQSYYESLLAKQSDLGEILLRMLKALEYVSFQESFHGAFSSANAAVHLITLRMESIQQK